MFTECLHTVLVYVKAVRKEGSYFENKVLMQLGLKKKKMYDWKLCRGCNTTNCCDYIDG